MENECDLNDNFDVKTLSLIPSASLVTRLSSTTVALHALGKSARKMCLHGRDKF